MQEYMGKNITIMCCSTCNTNCEHCYLGYNGDIPSDELYDMVNNLSKKYFVDLNGSEILLNIEYLKSIKVLKQNRVLTNGKIINNNPKLLFCIKKNGVEWVCMSYHFNLQNDISKISLKVVEDNISILKKEGFKVELMITIGKRNLYNIEYMVKKAIDLNVDCIRFTNFLMLGNAKKMDKKDEMILSQDEIDIFFDQFYKVKNENSDKILIRRSGTFNRDFRKLNSTYYCPAGIDKIAITPDFKVYPCPFLVSPGYEIGKYENGRVFIEKSIEYDPTRCLVDEIVNKKRNF